MTTTNDTEKEDKYALELEQLNQMFANRYTKDDKEYVEMTQRPSSPPIVDDWGSEGNFRRANDNHQRGSSNFARGQRNYSSDRRQQQQQQQQRGSSNYDNHYHHRDRSRSPQYHQSRR
ncbi:unnamed protein product [Adineta ricciae]|uniref:Uncharacterized protein n=1 Tax=Adineta ricciae TaxID=249248 RepID=A0A813TUU2_ADIRI|nr:unnamed protein product [Adineta ricciae]CAF1532578.1 unnamed protein product [Adineta ricciae]